MRFVFLIIFFLLVSCDRDPECPRNSHRSIEINNKSFKRIYVLINYANPETTLSSADSPVNLEKFIITPNEYFREFADPIRNYASCWESKFKLYNKVNVFFLDADVIERIPWEEVQKNNTGLLERREIDLDYCIRNNWQINFK